MRGEESSRCSNIRVSLLVSACATVGMSEKKVQFGTDKDYNHVQVFPHPVFPQPTQTTR